MSATHLGRRVRKLRHQKGLSQEDLAGGRYTAAYVSHVEHGRRRASYDALEFFAQRLGLTYEQLVSGRDPDDDIRLEVDIQRAIALIHDGKPQQARDLLEVARREAQRLSSRRAVARASEGIALSLYRESRFDDALAAYDALLDLQHAASFEEQTPAVVGIARCLFQKGKLHDAVDVLENHRSRLERHESPDPTALIQVYAGLIPPYIDLGKLDRAKDVVARSGDVMDEAADADHVACLYINRAAFLLETKQPREALMFLARAEDVYRQLGWRAESGKIAVARGVVFLDEGNLQRAEDTFSSMLAADSGVSRRDRARALAGLAAVRRRSNEPHEAMALARDAVKLTRDLPTEAAEANREAGHCAVAVGDDRTAVRYWRTALKLYSDADDKPEVARTSRLLGDLLVDLGDMTKAVAVYREGLAAMASVPS